MGSCEVVHGRGTSSAGVEWCCKERLIIAEAGMHCKEAVCMVMTSSESALCLGLNWFFFFVVLAAGFANTGMERLPEVSIVVH